VRKLFKILLAGCGAVSIGWGVLIATNMVLEIRPSGFMDELFVGLGVLLMASLFVPYLIHFVKKHQNIQKVESLHIDATTATFREVTDYLDTWGDTDKGTSLREGIQKDIVGCSRRIKAVEEKGKGIREHVNAILGNGSLAGVKVGGTVEVVLDRLLKEATYFVDTVQLYRSNGDISSSEREKIELRHNGLESQIEECDRVLTKIGDELLRLRNERRFMNQDVSMDELGEELVQLMHQYS
jgi:hypothetical protein